MPSAEALELADTLWGCPPGQRILTVGSLKDQQNHPLLLRAVAAVDRPNARLMLLGQGANEAALRMLAVDLGIADRVVFAGFHADPSPFYATANLFSLASDYEGLPTVLIEALSFGLPVVSTDCPSGPTEILQGGRFGRLVPVGDAPALARAMEAAVNAPVDREALILRAADFAPEIAARKYLDLLGLP
jgi:glycosyltransferase involved in cell wall biosynthesis